MRTPKPTKLAEILGKHLPKNGSAQQPQEAVQLPLWHDLERAMPNALARSALFAPVRPGRREMHDRVQIAGRDDVRLLYSGKQLDMADADVFLQVLELAKRHPLDTSFPINRAEFLRAINRDTGSAQYKWLDNAFQRLKFNVITCQYGTQLYELSLIAEWGRDEKTGEYMMMVPSKILNLFNRQQFGLINWEQRFEISKRVDLAKWLQTYAASHSRGEHRIGLTKLKTWSGYKSPLRHFRMAVNEALAELARVRIIEENYYIRDRDDMVVWTRC